MKQITIKTQKRCQLIDITHYIRKYVDEENINNGVITVFCPHTTAGITINENADPDVVTDILNHLEDIIPNKTAFLHAEGNSDSHIKSSLIGASEQIIVQNNTLCLGTWQGIYFTEFDGPRTRKVWIQKQ